MSASPDPAAGGSVGHGSAGGAKVLTFEWLYTFAYQRPLIADVIFETIPVPHPIGPAESVYALFRSAHYYLAMTLAVTLATHVLAALHHHFVEKDTVLLRMIPFGR